jgi:hypothetical protein
VEFVFDSSPDVLSGVENCFAGTAETLRQTDYAEACPIATVALEVASTNKPLREATAEVFESWIKSATDRFLAACIPQRTARELAIGLIGALEARSCSAAPHVAPSRWTSAQPTSRRSRPLSPNSPKARDLS